MTLQADQLLGTGPVEIALVDRCSLRGDGADLHATATLLDRRRGLVLSERLLNLVGGTAECGWSVDVAPSSLSEILSQWVGRVGQFLV